MRPTEKLQRDVVDELAWDPRVDSSEISVTITGGGVVTLEGEVPTFWQKRAVEGAAKRVSGVKAVANDLEVRLIRKHRRDDTDVAERAIRALAWHASVPDDGVSVTVTDGWVTLEGDVPWAYQRREAADAVRGLIGVRGVSNLIRIAPEPPAEDTDRDAGAIRQQLEEAFRRSADIDTDELRVDVEGDRVVLAGTVASWRQRDEAEWIAWATEGVTEVENRLEVHES